jgi:hypothetical protein
LTHQFDGLTRQFSSQLNIFLNQLNLRMNELTASLNEPKINLNKPGFRPIEVAERLTTIAHGFNRGLNDQNEASPGGTAESGASIPNRFSFAPTGLAWFWKQKPTAEAVGYYRALLRS